MSNNKTVLVTGVSQGIGKGIAEQLVSEGYFVHGTYNSHKEEAEQVKESLKNLEIHQVDFVDRSQTHELIDSLKEVKLDGLVNNAGIFHLEKFSEFTFENWDETLEVNLNAPVMLATGLKDNFNPGASIINIASTDGLIGSFASMAYSASKAALINVTKSLGNNFGPLDIRVNAIAPGWINTGMDTVATEESAELTPVGRVGKPQDIANVVSFLLSDKSSFVNGETILVDGGYFNVSYLMKKESDSL